MGDALAVINGRCTFQTMDGEKLLSYNVRLEAPKHGN